LAISFFTTYILYYL